MVLQMPRPSQHPRTGIYRCRQRIPEPLKAIIERDHGFRTELHENLGTKDAAEAKRLAMPVFAKFSSWLRAAEAELNGDATTLSDREISSLIGQWLAEREEANRLHLEGTAEIHRETMEWLGECLQGGGTMIATQEARSALAATLGLKLDDASQRRLATRLAHVQWQFHRDMVARHERGHWVPTVSSSDFPAPKTSGRAVPFDAILDGWAADNGLSRDAQPRQRAFYDRLRTIERLADFLKHRDAALVSKADAVRWKEEMQTRKLAIPTIRNDLSEMSAIWRWAIRNGKVGGPNPFEGVSPPKAKRAEGDLVRPYRADEAAVVLQAARGQTGALRWLPWVCAYTGARLNEIVQSHREDIASVSGVTCLRIHANGPGRSLKNDASRRDVPLHPALVAEGFLDYVNGLPAGTPLFPDIRPDAFGRRSSHATKLVGPWVRKLGLKDSTLSPLHSWRHTFIDACRAVKMPEEIRSALTGHSGKLDESAGYGLGMRSLVAVLAEEMTKVNPYCDRRCVSLCVSDRL